MNQDILQLAGQLMIDLLVQEAIAAGAPESILPLPPRTRRGTDLSQSNLIRLKRISYSFSNNRAEIQFPQYVTFIESGRRPARTFGSTTPESQGALGNPTFIFRRPPISVILEWMRRKGINSGRNNSVAFAISTAIAQRGIKARPFIESAVNKQFETAPEQIGDAAFSEIIQRLNLIFR